MSDVPRPREKESKNLGFRVVPDYSAAHLRAVYPVGKQQQQQSVSQQQ